MPVGAGAETLADALVSAYRKSNLLEQNRAVLRAADEDVALAVSTLRPTVNFIAGFDYNHPQIGLNAGRDAAAIAGALTLQGTITLFDSGRRAVQAEAAKETVLATRDALINIEQTVFLNAVEAFFDVRTFAAFVDLRNSNNRLISQELQAARDRFEVGEVTRTDVALAESRLAAARSELAAARGSLEASREAYKAAVGRYPSVLVPPRTAPQTANSLDAAKAIAVRTHPLIRQAQRQVTVAELNVDAAGRVYGPKIDLTATRQLTDRGSESLNLGLDATVPVYSGGRLPATRRKFMAQRDRARASLHQTVLNVQESVGRAWAQVRVTGAQIVAADQQITAAKIAFDGTREEARLGARTTLDVLDAEQELLNARANRIEAENQRYVAIYSLLSAMGLLTVDHLKLGVTTYDPAAYYNAVRSAPARHSAQGARLDKLLQSIGRD